jgi:hypothetical protein
MALPTFFIIGAPKTGTTSLHSYLVLHPQIQMSAVKEPNFFAPTLDPRNEPLRIRSREKYERLFDPGFGVRGEASTPYAEYPFRQGVPERIKELVPNPKLIYVVRDPVSRTLSHYHHSVAGEGERRSLEEIVDALPDPRVPCICASLYRLQVELYLRQFPLRDLLLVDHAELLSERRATLRKVFAFLGVDEEFDSPGFEEEFLLSTERRTYPPGLAHFVSRSVTPRLKWLPAGMRRRLRRSTERALLPRLEPSELGHDLRVRLQAYFADDAAYLRDLTGESLSSWSV